MLAPADDEVVDEDDGEGEQEVGVVGGEGLQAELAEGGVGDEVVAAPEKVEDSIALGLFIATLTTWLNSVSGR